MSPEQFDLLVTLVDIIVGPHPMSLRQIANEVRELRARTPLIARRLPAQVPKEDVQRALHELKSRGVLVTTRANSRGARREWVAL